MLSLPGLRAARPDDAAQVLALLASDNLEAGFAPDEFLVAEQGGRVVACGRLKPLADGSHELASVAVLRELRGRGLGAALVRTLLSRASGPVHALALAPAFFATLGFVPVDRAPEALREKAEGFCASSGFVPMTRARGPVLDEVRARYGAIAVAAASCCGPAASSYGAELRDVPAGAHLGLGTGNPVRDADPRPGEVVVDLGSGAGVDVFLAARRVGPSGRAIGVDATPQMIERARCLAADGGFGNVEFVEAPIERLPLADATADAVVSNCVVNLSDDKPAVLREAFRVLKPGGRLVVSDTRREGGPAARPSCDCADGALSAQEWQDALAAAGFVDVDVRAQAAHECCGTPRVDVRARKPR